MVRHIMADGKEVKDISGRVVTLNDKTKAAYLLLIKTAKKEETRC